MKCVTRAAVRLLLALLPAAPLAALAEGPAPVFDRKFLSSRANIETGRKVWEAQCRHCHGARAYPGKAPQLRPGGLEPGFIYDRVTNGFGKMPSWKAVFSEEQRRGVVAYIKSDDFDP